MDTTRLTLNMQSWRENGAGADDEFRDRVERFGFTDALEHFGDELLLLKAKGEVAEWVLDCLERDVEVNRILKTATKKALDTACFNSTSFMSNCVRMVKRNAYAILVRDWLLLV